MLQRVTSYNDGSVIATGNLPLAWQQAGNLEIGAFADIDMDPTNSPVYGLLYNWYVVGALTSLNRQVCPAGWKVPSEEDIEQLYDFLGTRFIAGRQLKSAGTLSAQTGLWSSPNVGPTGPTLFDALPSGWRDHLGFYQGKSLFTRPWSSTAHTQPAFARTFNMSNDLEIVTVTSVAKDHGNPIRCIKSD